MSTSKSLDKIYKQRGQIINLAGPVVTFHPITFNTIKFN